MAKLAIIQNSRQAETAAEQLHDVFHINLNLRTETGKVVFKDGLTDIELVAIAHHRYDYLESYISRLPMTLTHMLQTHSAVAHMNQPP